MNVHLLIDGIVEQAADRAHGGATDTQHRELLSELG